MVKVRHRFGRTNKMEVRSFTSILEFDSVWKRVQYLINCFFLIATDKHQMVYDENSGKVSLMIKAIGPGDEGEYTCTALNPYGEAICTVYISPEATKSVKKSKSGAKLHKSGSNKQIQMAQQQQQQQQMMAQQQQQSSFSSSMQQSSMSSSSSFHQGKHSV